MEIEQTIEGSITIKDIDLKYFQGQENRLPGNYYEGRHKVDIEVVKRDKGYIVYISSKVRTETGYPLWARFGGCVAGYGLPQAEIEILEREHGPRNCVFENDISQLLVILEDLGVPPELTILSKDELIWAVYFYPDASGVHKSHFKDIPAATLARVRIPYDLHEINRKFVKLIIPRLRGHVQRLCDPTRSTQENLFGLFIIDQLDISKLPDIAVTHEYLTTTWWWSISPYLLDILLDHDIPIVDAYNAIYEWGNTVQEADDLLPGLEEDMRAFGDQDWILSQDPTHPPHRYAKMLAQEVFETVPTFTMLTN